MMVDRRGKGNGGFTLLEVLVGAVILSAALAVIVNSIVHSSYSVRRALARTNAVNLADDQLARAANGEIKNLPASGSTQQSATTFNWQVRSESHETQAVRKLMCTVSWISRSRPQQISVQRLIVAVSEDADEDTVDPWEGGL